jgi:pimeloyl-ACP methyl ester carboxylesterase
VTINKLNKLTRRSTLVGGTAASVATVAAPRGVVAQGSRRPIVLVHGAWHGGWCYQRVVPILTAAGHRVHAPTLTGLADRSHLLSRDVNLGTHAKDIANLILWEDLQDVVLVGHSYGGAVISAAIELVASHISAAVFLDAFLPRSGESVAELSPTAQGRIREMEASGAVGIPPIPARAFAVNERDQAWVDAKCTPQPLQTFLEKPTLTGARDRVRRKVYIRAGGYASPTFDAVLERTRADNSWTTHSLPCGHDMMIDLPQQTADLIQQATA